MGGRRVHPEGEQSNLNCQVHEPFLRLCRDQGKKEGYGDNVSDWLRDLAARQVGYQSYAHYVQLVQEER